MINLKNSYIYLLFTILIAYTAYNFLWTRFGLGLTLIIQYLLLFLLFVGLTVYLTTRSTYKNSWSTWLIVLWVTQLLAFYIGDSNATTQFKESTFVLLIPAPIIALKYSTKKIKQLFIVLAAVSISMYFATIEWMRLNDENSYGGGYMILVALPVLLYFFRNKSILTQMMTIIILFVLVLTSMKRGDILATILGLGVFFCIKLKGSGKFDIRILLLVVATILIGYLTSRYLVATNEVFAWRLQQTLEGDSSNRDIIYSTLWKYFINAPFDVQLFGGGFDATLRICGERAHSDVLEILTCEGLVGLLIYLGSLFSLLRHTLRRDDITEKAILAFILVIWLVKMSFSMFIYSQPTIILFALTAYILNNKINNQYEY